MDSGKEITGLKVADLKRELKCRGLSTEGKKLELQQRLQEAMRAGDEIEPRTDLPLKDGSLEEALDEEEEIDEDSLLLESDVSEFNTSGGLPLASPPKPVATTHTTLNRSAMLSTSVDKKTSETVSPAVPTAAESPLNGDATTKPSSPTEKKTVSLKRSLSGGTPTKTTNPDIDGADEIAKKVKIAAALTPEERLAIRAVKFGVQAGEEARKLARAQRFGVASLDSSSKKEARAAKFGISPDIASKLNQSLSNTGTPIAASADSGKLANRAERFGIISPAARKLDDDERLKKRQERFGAITKSSGTSAPITSDVSRSQGVVAGGKKKVMGEDTKL